MARGWESKGVEEQIAAREAAIEGLRKPAANPAEVARRTKRDGLLLARARTVSALEAARDERYRTMLLGALAHLDSKIAELED